MAEPTSPLQLRHEAACDNDLLSVAWDPATRQVFVGDTVGQIAELDLTAESKFKSTWAGHVSFVSSLVLTSDQLISAGSDHRVIWWDRHSHRPLRIHDQHPQWVRALAISPDHRLLASTCDDMVGRIWETATGKLLHELRGHELLTPKAFRSKLYYCAFSPDGRVLATSDQIGTVIVWDVASGTAVIKIHAPHFFTHDTNGHGYGGIRSVAFSPDGKLLAVAGNQAGDTSTIGGSKSLIRIFDWSSGQQTHEWTSGGNFFYERIAFDGEGKRLLGAAGAGDGQQFVWFSLESKEVAAQQASPMLVFDMAMSVLEKQLLAVGRKDGRGYVAQWGLEQVGDPPV